MQQPIRPSDIFLSARLQICKDPKWDGAKAFEGVPSLMDGYYVLDRAQAHLGIRGYGHMESRSAAFFPDEAAGQ